MPMNGRRFIITATTFWLGYILLLVIVPRISPPDPDLPSAAAVLGYDTGTAFLVAVAWSFLGLLTIGFASQRGKSLSPTVATNAAEDARTTGIERGRTLEVFAAFAIFSLAYFPNFISRYGHYIEDNYFLSVLSRMQCGQLPYQDFEFLYGPLMIFPVSAWIDLFGFSMQNYFAFLAIAEGAAFALVMCILQRYVPDRRTRLLAFALLVPFLFDTLLGFNWIAWRRLFGVVALLIVSARPLAPRAILAAGALTGVSIAYSYEYGLLGLGAALCVHLAMAIGPERGRALRAALGLAVTSGLCWLALTVMATGATFPDYLALTATILKRASSAGLGGFAFYWTLHSLALMGLLAVAIVVVGGGIFRIFRESLSEGDRLLLGSVAYTIVGLKVALQRADVWHMGAPFIALILAFLLAPPRRLFVLSTAVTRGVWGLIAIAAFAQTVGLAPIGSYFASGLARGALDVITGKATTGDFKSRTYSVERERSEPNANLIALAEYMAEPERAERPVLFYGDRWWMGYHIGVCPSGYSFYDSLYSDAERPMLSFIDKNPDSLVVMSADVYDRLLLGGATQKIEPRELSLTERLGSWLSTVHYQQSPIEREIKFQLWKESLGDRLMADWTRIAQFDQEVILAKRTETTP
jgi:hypothetical protein